MGCFNWNLTAIWIDQFLLFLGVRCLNFSLTFRRFFHIFLLRWCSQTSGIIFNNYLLFSRVMSRRLLTYRILKRRSTFIRSRNRVSLHLSRSIHLHKRRYDLLISSLNLLNWLSQSITRWLISSLPSDSHQIDFLLKLIYLLLLKHLLLLLK